MYQLYEKILRASLKFICVTFILFNFVTSQFDEKNSRYLGCFLEENMDSENKLENYSTKKDCANYCFENDYPFAAVYKSACRCSRKYVSKLMKEIDENCINYNCFKNSSCFNFFQMYTTGVSDTNSFPREIYLGCLQERVSDDDNRLLKTFLNHYLDNSPQKCSEECFKNGYLYSGLTNGYILGTACWCGDQYPWVRHKIKESSCNQACSGDKSKKCGDYWKLSVYSTGLIDYPKQHTIGCFNKDVYNMTSKIIVPFQKECDSSSRCSHICVEKKFKYAALSENRCECSNENPDHAKQKNNCVKCNYDTTENCGSEESLNIYENTWLNFIKENMSEKYLGCYENSWMYPIMDGWNITITNGQNYDTIRQSCVASCFAKEFPYVAIMMSLKICTCSFVKPSIDAKVERHVKEQCHNSSTRYSVFATGATSHDLTGNHYIGCYEENHLQKIFDQETVNEFHISNTPEICSKYCYQKNFYYFGILSRKTCLCGNKSININEFPRLVDSKCNMQCPGDANKYCGGNKKIAAFVIGKDWIKLHNCLPNCECVLLSQYNTTVVDCSHGNLNNTVEINSMFASTSSLEMYLKYNIFQELPKLSSFNILTLDISNNVLDKLNGKHLPKNLKVLKLHNNKLQYFDKSTLIYLSSLDELTLSNNSWDCSCKFLDMFDFMINHRSIISDIDIVTCQTMSIPIVSMTKNNICPKTEWLYFYITIALVFIIFICFLCVRFDLHKKVLLRCSKFRNFDNILFQQTTDTETSETLMRMINYDELVTATDNWNKDRILGEGGFGVVYKGNWINTDVAIKRLKTKGVAEKVINMHTLGNKIQSSSREIMYLNAIKHDNILSMYGFTIHDSESCLIYQFMANGSLEDRLQCKDGSKPLNWPMRENIAIGSARGLQFMHNMNIPLIHGDIKREIIKNYKVIVYFIIFLTNVYKN
ncbi:uncharacterized protein LOC126901001 isoform X2 [Daktulosphaira vitifoliae]|uniref:uncharacterized protein LOC126901001 isoform X2 n=1 Tax=Daktulosphaira vitifoliae TaxID=58002 RepID=UPI0021A9AF2B|nr:uncharacterized protein LOC126901001 isoform X2 [Daktulosphaira vitifoliae]